VLVRQALDALRHGSHRLAIEVGQDDPLGWLAAKNQVRRRRPPRLSHGNQHRINKTSTTSMKGIASTRFVQELGVLPGWGMATSCCQRQICVERTFCANMIFRLSRRARIHSHSP
jgi:hypothetical protein